MSEEKGAEDIEEGEKIIFLMCPCFPEGLVVQEVKEEEVEAGLLEEDERVVTNEMIRIWRQDFQEKYEKKKQRQEQRRRGCEGVEWSETFQLLAGVCGLDEDGGRGLEEGGGGGGASAVWPVRLRSADLRELDLD